MINGGFNGKSIYNRRIFQLPFVVFVFGWDFFLCKHTMEYSDVRHDFSCGKHDHNMCGKAGKLESSGECNTEISPFLVQSSKVFG